MRWALLSPLLSSRGLRWEGSFLLLGLVSTLMIGREGGRQRKCWVSDLWEHIQRGKRS